MKRILSIGIALILINSFSLQAQLRLPMIFGDHMVIQRHEEIKIWGWTDPNAPVSVEFNDQSHSTSAKEDGKWLVILPSMAAGGPYKITISSGNGQLVLKDVLIGDVWVCSGQSNMEFMVAKANNAQGEIEKASDSMIRHFEVPNAYAEIPAEELKGGTWEATGPETVGDFTAVGYFFARELRKHQNVPIGLVNASWGGSRIESWMSAEAFAPDSSQETLKKIKAENEKQLKKGTRAKYLPNLLFNKMINPLIAFPIKGFLWYQGEANAKNDKDAFQYKALFSDMILDWRKRWGHNELPFLFVQLANFTQTDAWALLRESQSKALELSQTAQVVTIDIGDGKDIHPRNKQDVGYRLSLAARKVAYGEDIVYSGPVYKKHTIKKGKIIVDFNSIGAGLKSKNKEGGPKGFMIAGEDKVFILANAKIKGDKVIVWNEDITQPKYVRYAWKDNPEATLYNSKNLPASPFRTDK